MVSTEATEAATMTGAVNGSPSAAGGRVVHS